MIHIKLPFKTPTVNSLYVTVQTKNKKLIRIIPEKYRKLKKEIEKISLKHKKDAEPYKNKRLKVDIFVTENWLNKNKTFKKKDIANREKFIIDSVFKSLGIDDKQIWEINLYKEQSIFIEETNIFIDILEAIFEEKAAHIKGCSRRLQQIFKSFAR